MNQDSSRVRIQFVDGRHIDVLGTLNEVAERLGPDARAAHGFCEITDSQGNTILVNREHILYLERRGRR